jgi:hypothetical protein
MDALAEEEIMVKSYKPLGAAPPVYLDEGVSKAKHVYK